MKKMYLAKRILAGVMVIATMALSGEVTAAVTEGRGAVAEAAGRPVDINSCVISGDNVVVNVSCKNLPSSDDGKFYLYADEVFQDGCVGTVVATTDRGPSASFTFRLTSIQKDQILAGSSLWL